jgi:predicted GIY-YIG superfamily endonuclease
MQGVSGERFIGEPPILLTVTDEFQEWWAYVLVSEETGETYVGVTVDLERRLGQHNGDVAGGARRTRRGRPWRMARRLGPFLDRSEAQAVEYRIKQCRGKERLEWEP